MKKPSPETLQGAKDFALDNSQDSAHIEAGRKYLKYLLESRKRGGSNGARAITNNSQEAKRKREYMQKYRAKVK